MIIVGSTVGSKINSCLQVMIASIKAHAPEVPCFFNHQSEPSNFGDAYNHVLSLAFKDHDEVIVANDDVVITPNSVKLLLEDVGSLKCVHGDKLGFVSSICDNARDSQNIRYESGVAPKKRDAISPIFAWMSKQAFMAAQFPPINWYSDDVICEDLNRFGFQHYISRSYVHHVGSQTVGHDYAKLNAEALPWLRANRPEYVVKWWGEQWL